MKILVTAASRHGSTAEIAGAIATQLQQDGHQATIARPEEVKDLGGFDGIVVGSGVYAGHWLKPALDLVERLGSQMSGMPVWLFSSGPIGDPPKPEEDPVDVSAVMDKTGARDHRVFAGRLEKSLLSFPERAIVAALRAPYGDFRDWEEIAAWAKGIGGGSA
jgi:menaquinone-dependent protoporphyrinogen oxidase